jgi:endonuclease/exonuclease/phosphatase family metal-dependent hydrolase
MTLNLRFENDFDGENLWIRRRDLLVETVLKYRPQVLGTQEGKPSQFAFLSDKLDGYRISADSRYWDDNCQYPTLYYQEDFFTLVAGGEFWLSETPEVHLSKSWDSAFPRMISYALLAIKANGSHIWLAVTHLDHISEKARIEGARMICEWAEGRENPIILLGDFNDLPGSEVHGTLTGLGTPFVDSWQVAARAEDEQGYTHHGFTGIPQKGRIDWVLTTPEFKVLDVAVIRDEQAGRYPSDHFPYLADLELDERAKAASFID